jgi:hypothetical protein
LFEEKKESIILMRLKLENARLEIEHAALVDIDKEELESYNQIQKMSVEVYNLEKEINELSKSLKLFLIDIL